MGSISTGVGLISGIDTASLIDSLIALESRGRTTLQQQIARLQAQQTAMLDINARLLNLKSAAQAFRLDDVLRTALATSTNESILTATATTKAQPGTFQFIVKQLVATSQKLSKGYASATASPLGLSTLTFELGRGRVETDVTLDDLNGGQGVDRGRIVVTNRAGASTTIDLTDVTTLEEVLDRINTAGAGVSAAVEGDHLVVTDTSGGGGSLTIVDGTGDTTATDLGIAGTVAAASLTGTDVNFVGGNTALASLNDGNGVLVRNNVFDFRVQARDGTLIDVDLGRIDAPITTATSLDELNNGAGVTISDDADNPDLSIIARDGTQYDVDLTGVSTVGGLITRISNETGGHVALSIHADGDRFTVTDTVGGPGTLRVIGAGTNDTDTAEDLGILETTGVAADTFDGDAIPNTISEAPVVDLQGVIDRINDAEGNDGRIVAAVAADGLRLELTDTTGGGGDLEVLATAANPYAARDLGLDTGPISGDTLSGRRLVAALNSVLVRNLNGGAGVTGVTAGSPQTLTGTTLLSELLAGAGLSTNGPGLTDFDIRDRDGITYEVEVDGLATVQDLIDAVDAATGGAVVFSIEGQALRATDTTGGNGPFRIRDINGAGVATELGFDFNLNQDSVLGGDLDPVHAADNTEFTIVNRLGVATSIDVAADESLSEIVDRINAAGAGVVASLNNAGNGLRITDTSGGTANLTIVGQPATDLGIAGDVAANTIEGTNLQLRYVSEGSRLDDLNYGRGVGTGTIRITDGLGQSAEVSIGTDAVTLYDVIAEINSRGLAINARVNDNGDGLVIEESLGVGETSFTRIKVETVSGTAGRDLNIVGEADAVGGAVDGSYERTVDVSASDSLQDVVDAIADANIPVSASIINTGTGSQPYRLNVVSGVSGSVGELVIDTGGVDLGFTTLAAGRDAKVFFGSDDPADAYLLTSSTNSLVGVVPGVTIDLHAASSEAVTLTVDRDLAAITDSVKQFVTTINDVVQTVDRYDYFDTESEERGVLLGNSLAARVRSSIIGAVQQAGEGITGTYRFLSQIGIRVGADGQVQFDASKFETAYLDDPDGVEALLASLETSTTTSEEIAPGVTVPASSSTTTVRGFGDLFADLVDVFTDSVDGSLARADQGFDDRIALLERRIEDLDVRLENKRARLQAEFAAMESALARIQGQGNALLSLQANLALAQSSGGGLGL